MFEKQQKLEVSQEQFDVIEAALQTQLKILNIQAAAGGKVARARLNEVKALLARMSTQRLSEIPNPSPGLGWFKTLGV